MTETQSTEIIAKIAALAPVVAELSDAQDAAFEARIAAEAALLDEVIAKAKPALKALSSRIVATERTWWPDNVRTATETTCHEERGIAVGGSGPRRDHPSANDGSIEGEGLWILSDGTLAEVAWEGHWTKWQGRSSEERSTLKRISSLEAMRNWELDEIIAAVVKALEAHAKGGAKKSAETNAKKAETLRGLLAVLKG